MFMSTGGFWACSQAVAISPNCLFKISVKSPSCLCVSNPSVNNFSLSANWFVKKDIFAPLHMSVLLTAGQASASSSTICGWPCGAWALYTNVQYCSMSNGTGHGYSGRIQNENHKTLVPVWLRLRLVCANFLTKGRWFFSVVEHVLKGLSSGCWSAFTVDQILAKGDWIYDFYKIIKIFRAVWLAVCMAECSRDKETHRPSPWSICPVYRVDKSRLKATICLLAV